MRERAVVLIVDDATDNRSMYAEYLSFEGFVVLEAGDAASAMVIARRERPDVIVMDVGLPSVDGIEATKILRADPQTRRVPILVLSGHDEATEARAKAAGANAFVRKPCLPSALVEDLRKLLSR